MAGLLVWLPIGATVLVVTLLLDIIGRLTTMLPPALRPEELFGVPVPGLDIFVALLVLILTGVLAANLLGKRLVRWYESILAKIPLVRTVYGAVKHFSEIVLSDSNSSFKKALLIQYPREGLYSLAFQTSEEPAEVQAVTGEESFRRRLLGHSEVSHTINMYSGLEVRMAMRAFSDLLDRKRGTRA